VVLPVTLALGFVWYWTRPDPNEATYKGRTVAEWEEVIRRWDVEAQGYGGFAYYHWKPGWRTWLEKASDYFSEDGEAVGRPMRLDLPLLFDGEQEAIPVLGGIQ
jgi:hypothetical protein